MANIFDYLKWRGDISTRYAPFNEIDALILSEISYLDFSGIVPEDFSGSISIKDASARFFSDKTRANAKLGLIMPDSILEVLKCAANTRRFSEMKIVSFVASHCENETKQFSAMTVDTADRQIFFAFRGTDDTIVGWREDFNMSYCESVPAQIEAKEYLDKGTEIFSSCPIRLGGHSKGGNLAMYAALNADKSVRERISAVYSFDGPGFSKAIAESKNYAALGDRIMTFVPESSVIGVLLSHDTNYKTVTSTASGMYQHDGFTWNIDVDGFEILPSGTGKSQLNDKALNNWLASMDQDKRKACIEAIFEIIEASGAKTLTDLSIDSLTKAKGMILTLQGFDKERKKMLSEVFSFLIKEVIKSRTKRFKIDKKK